MKGILFLSMFFCVLSFASCNKTTPDVAPASVTSATTASAASTTTATINFQIAGYNAATFTTSSLFESLPVTHALARNTLYEQSGIASSKLNRGVLYVHEDSGNANQVYLTNATGDDLGYFTLTTVTNRDWEDITIGPGPVAGKNYIYVAEIGDNDAKYSSVFIYRFLEPDLTGKTFPMAMDIAQVDKIELIYPGGARNAESILIDPQTKDIYIASKESNLANIYKAAYPQSNITSTVLESIDQLPMNKATSGGISADGTEIVLKNKEQIWYWKRDLSKTIGQTLLETPQLAPYVPEYQGEGICFAADGSGYFTNTEVLKGGPNPPTISYYKRK